MENFRLLFLCTGNAARSVMAEAMLGAKLKAAEIKNVKIASAGTLAIENLPPSRRVESALNKYDLSVLQHRSHQLQDDDVKWADLIVGFEILHINYVRRNFPEASKKAGILRLLANPEKANIKDSPTPESRLKLVEKLDLSSVSFFKKDLEVDDPDRGGDIEMQACADEVSSLIDDFFRIWF